MHQLCASALLALILSTSVATAQWDQLSNFDSLSIGDLGDQGGWTTVGGSYQVVVDPADEANQALLATAGSGGSNAYIALGDGVDEGATGTLFFRVSNGNPGDLVFGSSDLAAPFEWNSYEGYMRLSGGNLDVRDGGSFVTGATYAPDVWTNIWLVLDNLNDTTTMYSSVGSAAPVELVTGSFRNGTTDTLLTANLRMGSAQNVVNGYLDDLYLAPGQLLSLPQLGLSPGDVNGDGLVDIDIDFVAIRDHFQQPVSSRLDGDLDNSDFVDLNDFRIWKNEFVAAGGSLQAVPWLTIPEPASVHLAISVALFFALVRHRWWMGPIRSGCTLGRHLPRLGHWVTVFCLALIGLQPTWAQLVGPIGNPIPARIVKSGLTAHITDFAELPNTTAAIGSKPDRIGTDTRINFLRESPDGRLFVNDLRGQLYVLDENQQPQIYVDLDSESDSLFPNMNFHTGLAAGFTTFAFHPGFNTNGLFYTLHSETPDALSPAPTFIAPDNAETGNSIKFHTVLTEWQSTDPASSTFQGSQREVARYGLTANNYFHPLGDISFNPHLHPGDADYGLMYLSGGDWGYINGTSPDQTDVDGRPTQLQRLDSLAGTIIRIDPRSPAVTGGPAGRGDYTVPTDNPFFEDADSDGFDDSPDTLGEIWAYGFRNGHRLAWTPDGRLLVSQIGQARLETTAFVHPGGNYGWPRREGTFVNGVNSFFASPGDLDFGANGESDNVFELPESIANGTFDDGFEYPVVEFDHSEGFAHAGGFVYRGSDLPQLQGKFIFGEVVNGRVFYSNYDALLAADDGVPETTAEVFELQLTQAGVPVELDDLVPGRVDLRFGQDSDGELYLLTKGDGIVRKLFTPDSLALLIDELTGRTRLRNEMDVPATLEGYSVFSDDAGLLPDDGSWLSIDDQDVGGPNVWQEASPTTMVLSELSTAAGLVLQPGDEIDLGLLWDPAKAKDLRLDFQLLDELNFRTSYARYLSSGDYNQDGTVDGQDLTDTTLGWQTRFGNDLDGSDFLTWQRTISGAAAFESVQIIPEPCTLILAPLALLAFPSWRP